MALPDDRVVLLHNPRCSKSRATKALLEERGVEFDERLYLEDPLSKDELADLARRLGLPPSGFVRTGEAAWKEKGLGADASEDAILGAIAAEPILLERPVVVNGDRAKVGRPPEDVLEVLG
jgi:arsenate reductase